MRILENVPDIICDVDDENYCLYIDTDSNYFYAYPLLKKLYPGFDSYDDDKKDDLLEACAIEYQNLVNDSYNILAKDYFNINVEHHFEIKTECTVRNMYIKAPRRYAQYISRKEGIKKDSLDIKGMEFKMVNFPKVLGKFFEKIIDDILYGTDELTVNNKVIEIKKFIGNKDTNYNDVSIPTSVKTLNNYLVSPPEKGKIFSKLKKGVNIAVRSAYNYNDLLKYHNLDKKHQLITNTEKIKWVYLLPNPYMLESIGYIDYDTPQLIKDFINTYIDRDSIFEKYVKKKIVSIFDDIGFKFNINENANKFFKF